MQFNSVAFLIFLPIVVILYYLMPHKYRWALLLAASYFFYGFWKVEFLVLIMFSTITDFVISRQLVKQKEPKIRKLLLAVSLTANLGLLFFFKYLSLFLPPMEMMHLNIYAVQHPFAGDLLHALYYSIPVGISFYTFQTMSYTIDVYFGRVKPAEHLGKFAVFVSFFPQLVAGPIERYGHLNPQLFKKYVPQYRNFSRAFRLILFGLFVKICVADNLAPLVDEIYATPTEYDRLSILGGLFGFGFQIYADFWGYTMIAQGAALCLGVELMDNFKTPYLARSISEFWKRWHISLSTWFRDYLYIPLGGNKTSLQRWTLNIFIVFVLSGFWHGANWTFLLWGAIHGLVYLMERIAGKRWNWSGAQSPALRVASVLKTFLLVTIAWVFFRIQNIGDAGVILSQLIAGEGTASLNVKPLIALLFALFILVDILLYNKRIDTSLDRVPFPARWAFYGFMIFAITALGGHINHPFIYFQF